LIEVKARMAQPVHTAAMSLLRSFLALAKPVLPVLLAIVTIVSLVAQNEPQAPLSRAADSGLSWLTAETADHHADGCPGEASGIHCVSSGCVHGALLQADGLRPSAARGQPCALGTGRLAGLPSRPALQPPIPA
jgi:hypothetical protein